MRYLTLIALMVISVHSSVAQRTVTDEMKDTEDQLYASTKQVGQFFRRFNGEEDEKGNRYYKDDRKYRDGGLRRKYLPTLFDTETGNIKEETARDFIKAITDRKNPEFLDFHDGEWLAEVNTIFDYKGRATTVMLYMKLQAQGQGHEWVIDDISFAPYQSAFDKDTSASKAFIHPMSHELDFMNLRKAFKNNPRPEEYTAREYQPDYLTLFIYEMKQGLLTFKTVKNVKFHFFSVPGWYFELSNFNRPGYNTGWLISNLMRIEGNQKNQLKDYIYDKL